MISIRLSICAAMAMSLSTASVLAHDGAQHRPAAAAPAPKAPPARAPARVPAPVMPLEGPLLGNRKSDIVIIEFSDYECPYCRRFHLEQLPLLRKRYIDTGIAQYLFKDFPMKQHRNAVPAAVAAHCAGEQGQYWKMQDLLFQEQARLGDALYEELATRLKLDQETFRRCRADQVMLTPIHEGVADGWRLNLNTTPTVLLGRRRGDQVVILRMAPGLPVPEDLVKEIENLRANSGRPLVEQATGN